MKAYRIIGAVFTSILMPLFIVLLCASLLLTSAANLVTDKSIDAIVENAMKDEEMKSSVSDMLMESIYGESSTADPQMKESIDQIMELPSVQSVISGIISDSADEITSGSFDGELNITEKIQNTITEEPELLPQLSEDVVTVLLDNDSFRTSIVQSITADTSALALGEEMMDMLLQEPAVQSILAQVVTLAIEDKLGVSQASTIDIAEEMCELIEQDPTLAQSAAEIAFPDEEVFRAAVTEAAAFADTVGKPAPSADVSKEEFLQYCLQLYSHNINDAIRSAVFNTDTDQTDYAPDAALDAAPENEDITMDFDEETVAALNQFAEVLNVFKSPLFILAVLGIFLFYYLFAALLTWSFRYPLIFSGIASILTSISLITVAMIPISDILAASAAESAESLVFALIASIWGVLSDRLMLIGTLGIVLGIALITVFIITGILIQNKKRDALTAEIKERTPSAA